MKDREQSNATNDQNNEDILKIIKRHLIKTDMIVINNYKILKNICVYWNKIIC